MKSEEILDAAMAALKADPELARRNMDMRSLLERAQSVADIVRAYQVGCIPPTAHPRQLSETEQAQFAACHMLIQIFFGKVDEGEEAAQQWLTAIQQECANYAAQRYALLQATDSTAH